MDDPDEDIRDWATFGLGTQTGIDGPDVRDALRNRLVDANGDVRDEALIGLARRHDRGVVRAVAARLGQQEVSRLPVEAAAYLADKRLLARLRALGTWWDLDRELLDEAIASCDPEQQASDLCEQRAFLKQLERAIGNSPGVSAALACDRLEREVSLLIEHDAQSGWYDFRALVRSRAGGDLSAAVQAVLSDVRRPGRPRENGSG